MSIINVTIEWQNRIFCNFSCKNCHLMLTGQCVLAFHVATRVHIPLRPLAAGFCLNDPEFNSTRFVNS